MQRSSLVVLLATFTLTACSRFDDPTLDPATWPDTPAAGPDIPLVTADPNRNLLWGDLHVHTALSYDAYTVGTRALPDDAYRYMKGETITHAFGYPIRATRPLDFGAVTDHVEYLGVPRHLAGEDADKPDTAAIAALRSGNPLRYSALYLYSLFTQMASAETREARFGVPGMEDVSRAAWDEIAAAAERHNAPGRFTTFVAYEWSSMPDERNLHRNVIYRSDSVPEFPFSSRDSLNPEALWRSLDAQRAKGQDALAIPHNGNVSGGRMYEAQQFDGAPLDAGYAALRTRNEPLSEIFQIKGTSETHPQLSPDDEHADFEIMDTIMSSEKPFSEPRGSYARDALRTGLAYAHREGFNPFRFGVIGSSDSHNASSTVEEDNYHGKMPLVDGTPAQRLGLAFVNEKLTPARVYGAAGLVAVWAQENTRESIFEAMRRKETYATSGPRITLRFFAGRDFPDGSFDDDWLGAAYENGVPMGGTLAPADGRSPEFLVAASRDPLGANLAQLQIIKLWVDDTGQSHEHVITIVDSAEDGAPQLSARWTDPDYDSALHALYYARVIEVPTPRHSTYDAQFLGVEPPAPTHLQERAVSSAIWVEPLQR